jgi:hypothetical protein
MKSKVSQFALAAVLAAGFAAPALAQDTNWKLDSDRSAGRLSIASTATQIQYLKPASRA